jgi:glycosyltransferase involved in cell wall biosynthesis
MAKPIVKSMVRRFIKPFLRLRFLVILPGKLQYRLALFFIINHWGRDLPPEFIRLALTQPPSFQDKEEPSLTIVGYIPRGSEGWILQFLFEDIARCSRSAHFVLTYTIPDVQSVFYASKKAIIFTLHPSFIPELVYNRLPVNSIFTFYTHTRLTLDIWRTHLHEIGGILPMNSSEATTLYLSHVNPSRIRVFPAGFDGALFPGEPAVHGLERDIDVLFVGRYVDASNLHYYERKNYQLLIPLAKELAKLGLTVAILGKGWEKCNDKLFLDSVELFHVSHEYYPSIYNRSKLFVNVSLQEGGPVSWLEAMACGCLTLSNPTGFALELRTGELKSYLMSLNATLQDWLEAVLGILEHSGDLVDIDMPKRNEFLEPARFQELAKVLESIVNDASAFQGSLRWPPT